MPLISFKYVFFVLLLLAVYYWLERRAQNVLLLLASLAFCASWDPRFALLLIASTAIDYAIGRALDADRPQVARVWLMWLGVAFDVGLLALFKYYDFFAAGLGQLTASIGIVIGPTWPHVVMPVGLSFYTLARLTHTLDVYYRKIPASRSFLDFAVFVSFFPLLASGPIERAANILPQLEKRRPFNLELGYEGMWLIASGLFKKVVIADHAGAIVNILLGSRHPSVIGTWVGIYAYAIQIYGDFAGYSEMARGTARLFGIEVMSNFESPYFSPNLSEHWKRWHISLSSFLDDYVYRPTSMTLRGLGTLAIVLATWVTFAVSALWHGTGVTFLAWGAVHASGLTLFLLTRKLRKRLKKQKVRAIELMAIGLTFHTVCLGYVFFRAPTMEAAFATLLEFVTGPLYLPRVSEPLRGFLACATGIFVMDLLARRHRTTFWILQRPLLIRASAYAALLLLIVRAYAPAERFIYFQF